MDFAALYDELRAIGNVLIVIALIVCVASMVVMRRVGWRTTEMGRHLMIYTGALAALLVLFVIRMVFDDSWWIQLFRLIVFIPVVWTMCQRLMLQIKAQRESGTRS